MPRPGLAFRPTVAIGVGLGLVLSTSAADAQTTLPAGAVSASQSTWTAAGSPYRIPTAGIIVPVGLTLRILPGVQVEWVSGTGRIDVEGTISVEGTAADPVRFGRVGSTQTMGEVTLRASSTATFRHARFGNCADTCIVDQSGRSRIEDSEFDEGRVGISYDGVGTAHLDRTRFDNFGWTGADLLGGVHVIADDLHIEDCERGIRAESARLNLTNSFLLRNNLGVEFWWLTTASITGPHYLRKNTFALGSGGVGSQLFNRGFPIIELVDNAFIYQSSRSVSVRDATTITTRNNVAYSNLGRAFDFEGFQPSPTDIAGHPVTVNELDDFRPTSLSPLRGRASDGTDIGKFAYDGVQTSNLRGWLQGNTTFTRAGSPYRLAGDLTVPPEAELTIEAGAEVLFADKVDANRAGRDSTRTELRIRGGVRIDGTAANPVRFATEGVGGGRDFHGLVVLPTGTATVSHLHIRNADVGIFHEGATGTYRHLRVEDGFVGFYGRGGAPRVEDSTFLRGTSTSVLVDGGSASFDGILIDDAGFRSVLIGGSTGPGTSNVVLSHMTVVNGGSTAITVAQRAQGTRIESSIIAFNSGFGVNTQNGLTMRGNVFFANSSGSFPGSSLPTGGWGVRADPLFAGANDYRITDLSPARNFGVGGTDAGAFAYTGTAPPPTYGDISQSTSWSGDVLLLGDVTVERGRSLTIAPGTRITVAPTDIRFRGTDPDRIELNVQGRVRMVGTRRQPIVLRPTTGVRGAWTGVNLGPLSTGSELEWVEIHDAQLGLNVSGGFGTRVRHLEVANCTDGVIVSGDPVISLDAIETHGHFSDGMEIAVGTQSITVTNLVSYDNRVRGLYVRGGFGSTASVTVDHATVAGSGDSGIRFSGVSGVVRNTLITGSGGFGLSVSGAVTYDNVAMWANRFSFTAPGLVSCAATFVDAAGGNYALQSTSGCRDLGAPTPLRTDFEGNLRAAGMPAIPDLGAFEFQPGGNRYPTARFNTGTPTLVVTEGESLLLDGRASSDIDGTIVRYQWQLGDGRQAEGSTVAVSYTTTNDVDVQLTVTDDDGFRDRETRRVITNRRPSASAGGSQSGDLTETFAFDGRSSRDFDGTIVSYEWDFGDGATGTGNVGLHRYSSPGVYTVVLTVTDNHGATDTAVTRATVAGGTDALPPTIRFTPPTAGVVAGTSVTVQAEIFDGSSVATARLFYRTGASGPFQSVVMTGGPVYAATIPAAAVMRPSLEYYIQATDGSAAANAGTDPAAAPATVHIRGVIAATAPTLVHAPIPDGRPFGSPVPITARATSPAGISGVNVLYRSGGSGAFVPLALTDGGGGNYSAVISGAAVVGPAVEYYLVAADTSVPARTTRAPASGAYSFTVVGSADTTPPTLIHAPRTAAVRASTAVTITATASDASGVASVRVFYRRIGQPTFNSVPLGAVSPTLYRGDLPVADVRPPGIEYYVEATDSASPQNSSVAPASAPSVPARFDVLPSFNLAPGDLVITEIMADPTGDEGQREWFEVYNPTASPIELNGLRFVSGTERYEVLDSRSVVVGAGDYVVFGRTSTAADNGGVAVDVVYAGLTFSNAADQLRIEADATVVDAVAYDVSTYPLVEGRSLNLAAGSLTASANDLPGAWCEARTALAGGDFGTPGAVNDACADILAPRIFHTPVPDRRPEGVPVTVTATVSDDRGVTFVTVLHRRRGDAVFSMTDLNAAGSGVWSGALPGTAVRRSGVEYYLVARDAAGNLARFPAMAPGVTLDFDVIRVFQLAAGDLVISEIMADPTGDEGRREWFELYNPSARPVDVDGLRFEGAGGTFTVDRPGSVVAAGGYYVLGRSTSPAENGGAAVDLAYEGLPLGNGADRLTVWAGPLAVDVVAWDARFEQAEGRSLNLASGALDANTNDQPSAWCASDTAMSGGDFGTPGASNASCADVRAPSIAHRPIADGQREGRAVTVTASVSDDRGVAAVTLNYRPMGGTSYTTASMIATGQSTWFVEIPAAQVGRPGIEYYLSATDDAGNVATFPAGAPARPLGFTVDRIFAIRPGDLVITEIMARPTGSQADGEWFELFNATAETINLDGLTFEGGDFEGFTVEAGGTLPLGPGLYAVFGRSTATSTQGVAVDYAYDGLGFSQTADVLRVRAGVELVDEVRYDGATHPLVSGRSLSLAPNATDASSNDDGINWCFSTSLLANGDFGTPGRVNDACADEVAPQVTHTPIADGQPVGQAVTVLADVTDAGAGVASVALYYRRVGAPGFSESAMHAIGGDSFQGEIPGIDTSTAGVEYYIRATDLDPLGNEALEPAEGPTAPHRFAVTNTDAAGPSMVHTAPSPPVEVGVPLDLVVAIADPSGIEEASLVLENGTRWPLIADGLRFAVTVPGAEVAAPELAYRFEARDGLGNEAVLPASDLFRVVAETPDLDPPTVDHTPFSEPRSAEQPVELVASITDANAVAEAQVLIRAAGARTFVALDLVRDGDTDRYAVSLEPALLSTDTLEYYFEAVDGSEAQNRARLPALAPDAVFTLRLTGVGREDLAPPLLFHEPYTAAEIAQASGNVAFDVTAIDLSGVAEVRIILRSGEDPFAMQPMQSVGQDRYRFEVPAADLRARGLDYYFEADDATAARNLAVLPEAGAAEPFAIRPPPTLESGGGGCSSTGASGAAWMIILVAAGLVVARGRS